MKECRGSSLSGYHIFSEPDPPAGIDIDPNANGMQGRTEKVDTVPAAECFVSHPFLNGGDAAPGGRIWSRVGNIFSAVAQAGETFIGDALARLTPIRAGMAESTVSHIPAMEKRARGQGCVPGKGRQATGCTIVID